MVRKIFYKSIFISSILLLGFLLSCNVYVKSVYNQLTYCYTNKPSGLDTLMRLDGYYSFDFVNVSSNTIRKEFVFFYENGVFLNISEGQFNYYKSSGDDGVLKTSSWGLYNVLKDTIYVQYISVFPATSNCRFMKYAIVDSLSIDRVLSGNCFGSPHSKNYRIYKGVFNLEANKPNPNLSKIIKKKWFWCEEDELRDYMDSINTN